MSNINLLYTDIINFNNNHVGSLLLNGSKIWGEPIEHKFFIGTKDFNLKNTANRYENYTIMFTISTLEQPLRNNNFSSIKVSVSSNSYIVELGIETSLSTNIQIIIDSVEFTGMTGNYGTFLMHFRAKRLQLSKKTITFGEDVYFKYPQV